MLYRLLFFRLALSEDRLSYLSFKSKFSISIFKKFTVQLKFKKPSMKRLCALLFSVLLHFTANAQDVKEISRTWTSFSQSIEVEVATDSIKRFKIVAFAKVDTNDEQAWAGIWARVDNKPGQGRGFFDNMGNRPIKLNEWKSYEVQGIIDDKSAELNFGVICSYNGKFFFDKFEVYIEDDHGFFQPVEIHNPSFESEVSNRAITGWNYGVGSGDGTLVREFSAKSSNDSVDGNFSVLIEGKGISEKVGSIEAVFPNIGIAITIIFILIVVLSLLTYTYSSSDEKQSVLSSIGFRFSFIYFLLFIFFQNNGAYPFFNYLAKIPLEWMQSFAPWFGEQVLGIPFRVNTSPNGSGDTGYDYLVILIIFSLALLGTIIWSIIDRRQNSYTKLYYWLTTAMRFYVGLMLINYGLSKVIQLQFPEPNFYRLLQPYGESSPMGLAWTFLGFSKGYNMFMGIAEVLAGLLLFRRTLTLGAIITLMTTMNVMAVNYFFDVPVKILSTHLVVMTLFLLAKDFRKVMQFLLTNNPVNELVIIARPKLEKGVDISLKVLKGLVIVYALGYGFYRVLESQKIYGTDLPKPPLYGVYEVADFVVNGDTLTNYKSPKLWKNIRFEREGMVQIEKMNKQREVYNIELDTLKQKIRFMSMSGGNAESFDFNYLKTDNTLDFNFIVKNDTIIGTTKKLGKDKFLLVNRGFNWISEYPYNR